MANLHFQKRKELKRSLKDQIKTKIVQVSKTLPSETFESREYAKIKRVQY